MLSHPTLAAQVKLAAVRAMVHRLPGLARAAAHVAVPRAAIARVRTARVGDGERVRRRLGAAGAAVAHAEVHGETQGVVGADPALFMHLVEL